MVAGPELDRLPLMVIPSAGTGILPVLKLPTDTMPVPPVRYVVARHDLHRFGKVRPHVSVEPKPAKVVDGLRLRSIRYADRPLVQAHC